MASWTSHFGQLINEVRGYVSAEHTDAGGLLALPEARVHVTSDLPDSIRGIATLTFGGNHAFPQHTDNTTAEVRQETSSRTSAVALSVCCGKAWLPPNVSVAMPRMLSGRSDVTCTRPEERRGGKECRSRLSPYQST